MLRTEKGDLRLGPAISWGGRWVALKGRKGYLLRRRWCDKATKKAVMGEVLLVDHNIPALSKGINVAARLQRGTNR